MALLSTLFSKGFISRIILFVFLIGFSILFLSTRGLAAVKIDEHLRLTVKGKVYNDETVVRFNSNATNAFDMNYDAYKIMNGGTTPSLYSKVGATNYSINSVQQPSLMPVVDLSLMIMEDGLYTMTILNNTNASNYVLVDKKLGVQYPVNGSVYSFMAYKTDKLARFELRLEVVAPISYLVTSVTPSTNADMQVYSSLGGVVIKTDRFVGVACSIQIIDMNGEIVKSIDGEVINASVTYLKLNLSSGGYLMQIKADGLEFSDQILLQ